MIAGNGVMAGRAAEFGMGGMAKVFRIDIVIAADLFLITVACDAGFVFACAITKRIIGGLGLSSSCNPGHNEQHHDYAMLC
jgi:hypothetical protein